MLQFLFTIRDLPDAIALCFVTLVQTACAWALLRERAARESERVRAAIATAWTVSVCALVLEFILNFGWVARHFPAWVLGWGRGLAILWAFLSVLLAAAYAFGWAVARVAAASGAEPSPARRQFLGALRWSLAGTSCRRGELWHFRAAAPAGDAGTEHPDGRPASRIWTGLRIAQLSRYSLEPVPERAGVGARRRDGQ